MHSRVFEIECEKGMTEGINYDLPDWWTDYYPDWYDELDEESARKDIEACLASLDIDGDMIDFGGEKAQKILEAQYRTARDRAEEFLSLSLEDFKRYSGLDKAEEIASAVEHKYGIWFFNPAEGEEICTLDEMLHRGGKYHLTGRAWDWHW